MQMLLEKFKNVIKNLLSKSKYEIRLRRPSDFSEFEQNLIQKVSPYTMTEPEKVYAFIHAVRYVINAKIKGDIVECGVWRGGSMMAAALTLLDMGVQNKNLFLYDTYEGMPSPSTEDVSVISGETAESDLKKFKKDEKLANIHAYASLDSVKKNVLSTNYPREHVHFIKGLVEHTIPEKAPKDIAILRLDTDWYSSTHHTMTHLFPRLARGGILILDDYGHWQGAKKAVDEYIKAQGINNIYLARINYSCRVAVKL